MILIKTRYKKLEFLNTKVDNSLYNIESKIKMIQLQTWLGQLHMSYHFHGPLSPYLVLTIVVSNCIRKS